MPTVRGNARTFHNEKEKDMLQTRHLAIIAATIRDIEDDDIRQHVADKFARACKRSNPSFKAAVFYKACNAWQPGEKEKMERAFVERSKQWTRANV